MNFLGELLPMRRYLLLCGLALSLATLAQQPAPPPPLAPVASPAAATPTPAKPADAEIQMALAPVKTDSPRDTMRTFYRAMQDYARGIDTNDKRLQHRIDDAVACLDLSQETALLRDQHGTEAAVFLKEVIDRAVVIDFDKVPEDREVLRWRLRNTNITIVRVESGPRRGEFLFSPDTVAHARDFYLRCKALPYLKPESGDGARYRAPWLERHVPDWARQKQFLFSNWQWLGIAVALLLGLLMRHVAHFACGILKHIVSRSETEWDDRIVEALERPLGLFVASLLWLGAWRLLLLEGPAAMFLNFVIQIVLSVALIWAAYRLSDVLADYLGALASRRDAKLDTQFVPLIRKSLRIVVILVGILVACQNLGFNVMSVLAGLGLGGLAFALAARDTCANFFGSLMLLVDRPFQVGDAIAADKVEGTVEEIGFRSTRIRTFHNSQLSVPNSTLANINIDNMGRRQYRRIKANFGLTYDTPPEKIEAFVEGLKSILNANPKTRKDNFQVAFTEYGDSGLTIMLYCYLQVSDWGAELVERQRIYLEVLRLAKALGVEFAFPTRTLHVESFPEKQPLRPAAAVDREQLAATVAAFGPGGSLAKPQGHGLSGGPTQP